MPGAWELTQPDGNDQVLVAVLTREQVTTAWAFGFRNLVIPGTYTGLTGMPFDHARNTACERAMELNFQWLFFLDDDVICPPDTILRLLAHNKPIVSGLYYRRATPIIPVMLKEQGINRNWITEFNIPELLEVDYVGAGCLLIHRDVLASLPPISTQNHWFDWRVNRTDLPPHERMSEDFVFCKHARNGGYKIYVDTSVQCKHAGFSEAKHPGQLTPLELM